MQLEEMIEYKSEARAKASSDKEKKKEKERPSRPAIDKRR